MNLNRDIGIIEKIYNYCNEIDEAHNSFNKSYDTFKINSVYKNAVCLLRIKSRHRDGLLYCRRSASSRRRLIT